MVSTVEGADGSQFGAGRQGGRCRQDLWLGRDRRHGAEPRRCRVRRPKFTAIMGPSGSGKSTLLNCLAGLDDLTSGEIFIGDTNVSALNEKHRTVIRRDRIGFIFQSYNLVPTLTAEENILLPMALARREPDREWVDRLIETIGIADRLHHHPTELSGGQQQRVAVARALASRPQIVFADEPTGNLDSRRGAEILSFMQTAVREFGQSIVMVTHDPSVRRMRTGSCSCRTERSWTRCSSRRSTRCWTRSRAWRHSGRCSKPPSGV